MPEDDQIRTVEVIPVRLPLIEPFVISYATYPDVLSVLVRITTSDGATGWGEATPDPNVTGETWGSTISVLRDTFAPALIGQDAANIETNLQLLDSLVDRVPSAKAAIDIALFDLAGRKAGLPVFALLGGRSYETLTISRVVSMKSPSEMAADAVSHLEAGFKTVKIKVGESANTALDVERILEVRQAIGPNIGLKIDVNQGWQTAAKAIPAIRAALPAHPDYFEQPVAMDDLEGLAEVRHRTGAPIMADEACHGPRDAQRIVQLRAADLVNIKLMKTGGLLRAVGVNAIVETAGIRAQVGTMVESSIASAAGLHFGTATWNVKTMEMGGPLMLREDIGNVREWYKLDQITVPDLPGLGIEVDESAVRRFSDGWSTVH